MTNWNDGRKLLRLLTEHDRRYTHELVQIFGSKRRLENAVNAANLLLAQEPGPRRCVTSTSEYGMPAVWVPPLDCPNLTGKIASTIPTSTSIDHIGIADEVWPTEDSELWPTPEEDAARVNTIQVHISEARRYGAQIKNWRCRAIREKPRRRRTIEPST
jgi:hypothetical protein